MPYIIYNKLKEEKDIAQIFDAPINLEDTSNILAYSPEIVTNYSYINPILAYIGLCCIYVLLVPYLYQKREILFAPFYVVFSPIKWLSQKLRLISAIDIAIKEGYFVFYWTVCWLIVRFSGVFSGLFNLLRDWSNLYFTNSLFINISLTLSSLLFALIFALLLTCILSCIKPLQNKLTKIHKGLYYSSNQSIFVNFVILTTYCFDWLNYSEERLCYEYGVTWFLFFNYVVINSYISLVFLILWLNLKLYFSYVLKQIFPELVGYKLFLDKKGLSKWVKLHCTIFGGLKRRAFYLYFKKQDNVNEKIARRIKALALTVEALKQEEEENSNNFWKLDWDNSEFNIDVGTSQIFYKKNLSWLVPYHYDYLFKVFIWNNQMILEEQDICDEKFSSMDRKPLSKMKDLTANTNRREFHSNH